MLARIAIAVTLVASAGHFGFDFAKLSLAQAELHLLSPEPTSTVFATNEVDRILNSGKIVPFEVCGTLSDWNRPTEADQSVIWESPRYSGALTSTLRYPWTHHFLLSYGSASVDYDLINLSGLRNTSIEPRLKCRQGTRLRELLSGNSAELWALGYEIRQIRRSGNRYVIVVVPDPMTVAFIRLPRPKPKQSLTFIFVADSRTEVERLDESQYPYGPYR